MKKTEFRKNFWDNKILAWEKEKYSFQNSVLDLNSSLKNRMTLAKNILAKVAKNKVVLELGCGSGLLLRDLDKIGVKKYVGIDVSTEAIKEAQRNAKNLKNIEVEFINSDLSNLAVQNVDICFSLGFLDWIFLDEIKGIKSKISADFFFHSFSERRVSPFQIAHKIFVYFKYGYKSDGYKPNYYSEKDIGDCFSEPQFKPSYFRANELSFGAFVYKLPFKITENLLIDE